MIARTCPHCKQVSFTATDREAQVAELACEAMDDAIKARDAATAKLAAAKALLDETLSSIDALLHSKATSGELRSYMTNWRRRRAALGDPPADSPGDSQGKRCTMEERYRAFHDTCGASGYISAVGQTGANLHPDRCVCQGDDRCVCQGDDPTPHKHYEEGSRRCARCSACNEYRPVAEPAAPTDADGGDHE